MTVSRSKGSCKEKETNDRGTYFIEEGSFPFIERVGFVDSYKYAFKGKDETGGERWNEAGTEADDQRSSEQPFGRWEGVEIWGNLIFSELVFEGSEPHRILFGSDRP